MDTSEHDKFGFEECTENQVNHQSSGIPADWQFGPPSMNMVSTSSSTAEGLGLPMTSSPCPPVPIVDNFTPNHWNHPANSPNLGFTGSSIPITMSVTNGIPVGKPVAMPSRGMFLPTIPGAVLPSLSHFPADSAFIERAARFSCFSSGNLSGMINSFSPNPSMASYGHVPNGAVGVQLQKSEFNMTGAKVLSQPVDHRSYSGSPIKNHCDKGSTYGGVLKDDHPETNLVEGSQKANANSDDAAEDSSPIDHSAKKRKRINQDMEMGQVHRGPRPSSETTSKKVEQSSSKHSGKHVKDSYEVPKEEYVHVRARRGQATNSHSLAERVRREKISERMKYLQDLVPGCSKVTGKAVMLDEIINYVQSLQRQVEFLSMKLAAVNPRLDFNIESLLAKDLLHSRAGSSSTFGFPPEIIHPQLHPSLQGLVQPGISGLVDSSDTIRRMMTAEMSNLSGYKDPVLQVHNPWDEELHNVMQTPYGANPPINLQESNSKPLDGFPIQGPHC